MLLSRPVRIFMKLVLIVRRQLRDRLPFAGAKAHRKSKGDKREYKTCHGAAEISGRRAVAKCFVEGALFSPVTATRRGSLVNHDFREAR